MMTASRAPTDAERIAVAGAIARLSLHGDWGEWALVEDGLAPMVDTDYVSLLGGEPATQTAAQVVAGYRQLLPGFDAVQHLVITMDIAMLDDARATAISYVRATHRLGERLWVCGGEYQHGMALHGGRWRARSIRFVLAYEEGDRAIVAAAAERASAGSASR